MSVINAPWLGMLLLLPLTYWLTPERFRWITGSAITLVFLGYYSPMAALMLPIYAILCWLCGKFTEKKGALLLGACILVLSPFLFLRWQGVYEPQFLQSVVVPLGIAYFSLRAVHYLVENYKKTIPPHNFPAVLEYFLFLPTLIAGPINRFPQFLNDRMRSRFSKENISLGIERIIYGYVKINFLANYVINYIIFEKIEKLAETSPQLAAYCTMFSQGFNGYLQFSGYSDIAIGFSLLLGYRVMENFNWPFFKKNIQEFWSAWHISLTSWCREYVYLATFSLTRERWLGILVAMGVLGLWHEFSARYLLWGAYNGLGIVIWYQWRKIAQSAPLIVLPSAHGLGVLKDMGAICLNLHFVLLGFVLVNNENLTGAVKFYRILFGV